MLKIPVLTRNCAIIYNPGAPSRNGEQVSIHEAVKKFYDNIEEIKFPGTVDGGDVMMAGEIISMWVSLQELMKREQRQFIDFLRKYDLDGTAVPLNEMLHLKTGLAYLENNNLLIAGEFIESPYFKDFNKVIIPEDEGYAANCIWMNDHVLIADGLSKG